MRWPQRYMSRSKLMMVLRLTLGGITAAAPRSSSSALSLRVERFVAEQSPEGDALDQRPHADTVVMLAGQQDEAHLRCRGRRQGRRSWSSGRRASGRWP